MGENTNVPDFTLVTCIKRENIYTPYTSQELAEEILEAVEGDATSFVINVAVDPLLQKIDVLRAYAELYIRYHNTIGELIAREAEGKRVNAGDVEKLTALRDEVVPALVTFAVTLPVEALERVYYLACGRSVRIEHW